MTDRQAACHHAARRGLLVSLPLLPSVLLGLLTGAGEAGEGGGVGPVRPKPTDKCPVCGMFVSKYPDWVAQAIYRDGSYSLFDGAKDLFKYLLDPKRYAPTKRADELAGLYVTDYYALTPIDARKARYVIGSDVLGPMGREAIPFAKEAEAQEFLRDHKGKRLLAFSEVTAEVVKGLE
jgi:nitrous oxide reductase accessory protein NosL